VGTGKVLSIPSFLNAVKITVERHFLGSAKSTIQFSRSIGGTLGVSVMGAALNATLAVSLSASDLSLDRIAQFFNPSERLQIRISGRELIVK
jgi:hypothetical protein